jgi:hypothetical protein
MTQQFVVPLAIVGLFAGMLVANELGRRLGERALARDATPAKGIGPLEAAVFGLFGLLLAFTFGGGAERIAVRRQLIVSEANAVGTAYLRLDLLPAAEQPALRELFRSYVDARLTTYRLLPDLRAAEAELARSLTLQSEIWNRGVAGCGGTAPCAQLLLPALNEMIDIVTTRTVAARTHTPVVIYGLLFVLALVCSLLAGYSQAGGGRGQSRLYVLGFTTITVLTIAVILDMEYPRIGLIRLDAWDQLLVDVRQSMK